MFSNALNAVLTLLLIGVVGFLMHRAGWIDDRVEDFLTKAVLKVFVPISLFNNALKYVTADFFRSASLAVPAVIIFACFGAGILAMKLTGVQKGTRGIFLTLFSCSNTLFVGLPVCSYFFGEIAVPYISMYYMCNTILFWVIGVTLIAADGGEPLRPNLQVVIRLVKSPITAFLIGCVVKLMGLSLPTFLSDALSSLGSLGTPLSTILIGAIVGGVGLGELTKLSRQSAAALLGRFVVCPAIALLCCRLFQLPALVSGVFVMMTAMPMMNQALIMARQYRSDVRFASQCHPVSMLLTPVVIPVVAVVIGLVFPL